jgi:hypothetical protein
MLVDPIGPSENGPSRNVFITLRFDVQTVKGISVLTDEGERLSRWK